VPVLIVPFTEEQGPITTLLIGVSNPRNSPAPTLDAKS
jgi:hypothetical protein